MREILIALKFMWIINTFAYRIQHRTAQGMARSAPYDIYLCVHGTPSIRCDKPYEWANVHAFNCVSYFLCILFKLVPVPVHAVYPPQTNTWRSIWTEPKWRIGLGRFQIDALFFGCVHISAVLVVRHSRGNYVCYCCALFPCYISMPSLHP